VQLPAERPELIKYELSMERDALRVVRRRVDAESATPRFLRCFSNRATNARLTPLRCQSPRTPMWNSAGNSLRSTCGGGSSGGGRSVLTTGTRKRGTP